MPGTKAFLATAWLLSLFSSAVVASPIIQRDLTADQIAKQALTNSYKVLNGTLQDGLTRSSCTSSNVAVRKEYGDMSNDERSDYINAVQCILKAPSKLPAGQYPGAKSRYDDFVVVHMNMTPGVHGTANFMHWHRYYIWAYETALRTECGYKGYQPYWNWGKYSDLTKSPIFNGDQYSMGGNGESVPHKGMQMGYFNIPAGPGGGCVKTGPFANLTIHLGPLAPMVDSALNLPANPRSDGFGDNPRCLRRDVNNFFTSKYTLPANLATQILTHSTIGTFQNSLQTDTSTQPSLHSAGHFSIWGDPGGDVYVSPAEPTFWLHHGQLDRHWWMWANYLDSDLKNRTSQYEGGTNWMNPNSAKGHITDKQWLNVVAPTGMEGLTSQSLISTTAGPFCYVYV